MFAYLRSGPLHLQGAQHKCQLRPNLPATIIPVLRFVDSKLLGNSLWA